MTPLLFTLAIGAWLLAILSALRGTVFISVLFSACAVGLVVLATITIIEPF